jgi:cytidine deaminase
MKKTESFSPGEQYAAQDRMFWEKHPELAIEAKVLEGMIVLATEARENAVTIGPTNTRTGAAILTASGRVFRGCTVDPKEYNLLAEPEEVAIAQAIAGGEVRRSGNKFIRAIVVVSPRVSAVHGLCFEAIAPFCGDALVVGVNPEGDILQMTSLSELRHLRPQS